MATPKKSVFINSLIEASLDAQVYQDLRKTFARETISFIRHGNLSITNTNPKLISRVQFTECEITPFHKNDISCEETEPAQFTRQNSTAKFADRRIDFATIQQLLTATFSPAASGTRPYPSAGGLYPVEPLVFLFNDRINGFNDKPQGCYHFRPVSKKLQLIKELDINHFYQKMLHEFVGNESGHWPNFCILYLAHLGKAIFKYRYRGYRHALMEAGAMYQQATLTSQQAGLRTTVWSTFSEQQMLFELGLNHETYLPLTMQLFGYGE
ncbi:SagB/ThcOx family dehydrogenase [Legionella dresdenensis]|uniref:SagB/ThcOx family dehydrogenase n=1 Tax=Legionella dresdenensis TaxID=450200 RepID=A0ABV8CGX7_9GAMM